jgi:hypothetical protein
MNGAQIIGPELTCPDIGDAAGVGFRRLGHLTNAAPGLLCRRPRKSRPESAWWGGFGWVRAWALFAAGLGGRSGRELADRI